MSRSVYPKSVNTKTEALEVAMDTRIALENLAAQPDDNSFVAVKYIQPAPAVQ